MVEHSRFWFLPVLRRKNLWKNRQKIIIDSFVFWNLAEDLKQFQWSGIKPQTRTLDSEDNLIAREQFCPWSSHKYDVYRSFSVFSHCNSAEWAAIWLVVLMCSTNVRSSQWEWKKSLEHTDLCFISFRNFVQSQHFDNIHSLPVRFGWKRVFHFKTLSSWVRILAQNCGLGVQQTSGS